MADNETMPDDGLTPDKEPQSQSTADAAPKKSRFADPYPLSLSPAVRDRICEALEIGLSPRGAAAYGGVSFSSFNRWYRAGEKLVSELELNDDPRSVTLSEGDMLVIDFYLSVRTANTALEAQAANVLYERAIRRSDPEWAAYILKTRFPEDYGGQRTQKLNIEVSGAEGKPPVTIEQRTKLAEADIDRISAILGVLAQVGAIESGEITRFIEAGPTTDDAVHQDRADSETSGIPPVELP